MRQHTTPTVEANFEMFAKICSNLFYLCSSTRENCREEIARFQLGVCYTSLPFSTYSQYFESGPMCRGPQNYTNVVVGRRQHCAQCARTRSFSCSRFIICIINKWLLVQVVCHDSGTRQSVTSLRAAPWRNPHTSEHSTAVPSRTK